MYSTCKLLSLRSSPFPDSTVCAAVTSSSAKLQVKDCSQEDNGYNVTWSSYQVLPLAPLR